MMIRTLYQRPRVLHSCLCLCVMLPTLTIGQTLEETDHSVPNVKIEERDQTGPLRDVPVLEKETGFVPQITQRTPNIINVPNLVIVVKEPVEISVPDLVIVVKEPVEIAAPELRIIVKEPVEIDAPDLVIVIKDETDEGDEKVPFAGGGGGAPLNGQNEVASNDPPPVGPQTAEPNTSLDAKRICVGEYTVHSAGAVGSGFGNPEMPVGTPVMAKASLTTDSCGAFLTMTSQGQGILLARQHGGENVYVGELTMSDNVSRTLHLTCGRGLNMWGVLYASDENIKVRRQMWLRPVNTTTTTLASCAK